VQNSLRPFALSYWQRYCTAVEQWARAKLCGVEHRSSPIFGRATTSLGIGPHFSFSGFGSVHGSKKDGPLSKSNLLFSTNANPSSDFMEAWRRNDTFQASRCIPFLGGKISVTFLLNE